MMFRLAAVGAALLASGAIASAESASPVDGQLTFKASVGNNFEIQSSRLALNSSSDPEVRSFARRMIADHTKAQQGLGRAAAISGADAGDFLDEPHEAKLTSLSALTGTDFDQAYVAQQVEAHHETLQVLDDIAAAGGGLGASILGRQDPAGGRDAPQHARHDADRSVDVSR